MDRENVITHLQIIHTWAEFARERDLQFFTAKHLEDIAQWADDALELLKAQRETIDELISADKALKLLKEQPEIVRCKDCKAFVPYEYNEGKSGQCDAWMASTDCDGYCYLAEGR